MPFFLGDALFESRLHVMGMHNKKKRSIQLNSRSASQELNWCPLAHRTIEYVIFFYGAPWTHQGFARTTPVGTVQELLKASIKILIMIDIVEWTVQNVKSPTPECIA